DCTGPMCTYTGPAPGAAPGPCTETAGYISKAEINDIIAHHPGVQTFHDAASDSDVVVYDSVQWIAYMSDATKATRTAMYKGLNMGGVSDWAVDLQASLAPPSPTAPTPPAESGNFSDPIGPNGWMNPYLQNCTIEQADMINEAWLEAATLAQYHYEWWANQKWQDAMTLYVGENSKMTSKPCVSKKENGELTKRKNSSWITGKGPLYSGFPSSMTSRPGPRTDQLSRKRRN
ncbi:hypothetical protein B0H14DRAFT_2385596, partial [Mycena olivaceomarginata]